VNVRPIFWLGRAFPFLYGGLPDRRLANLCGTLVESCARVVSGGRWWRFGERGMVCGRGLGVWPRWCGVGDGGRGGSLAGGGPTGVGGRAIWVWWSRCSGWVGWLFWAGGVASVATSSRWGAGSCARDWRRWRARRCPWRWMRPQARWRACSRRNSSRSGE